MSAAARAGIWSGWGMYALAVAGGAVAALGLAPTGLWPATLLALSALFAAFGKIERPRAAAAFLWWFGLAYFGVGLRWIVEPFQIEADLFGWMAPFALVLMASGLALFWALAGAVACWLSRSRGHRTLALVASWSGVELARAYVLTGFPWAGFAQIWVDTALMGALAWIGPHGLAFVTLAVAALPVWLAPQRSLWAVPIAAAALSAAIALWPLPAPDATDLADAPVIRIVQPNAPQDEKWAPGRWQTFFWRQIDATAERRPEHPAPDLVVWPETAIPQLLGSADEVLQTIADAAQGTPVVFGALRRDASDQFFNALAVTGAEGAVQSIYDKHHLVPFGEYMPFPDLFRRLGIRGLAERAQSGFAAGPGPRLLDLPGLGPALPLICYEAVFARHARVPGARPRLLLQITNDAWFGTSAGPQQHLAQARMRAAEQGVPLVRAANTGISAIIDARGQITQALPLGVHGHIDAPLPPMRPATLYSRTGNLPALALSLLLLSGLAVLRRAGRSV